MYLIDALLPAPREATPPQDSPLQGEPLSAFPEGTLRQENGAYFEVEVSPEASLIYYPRATGGGYEEAEGTIGLWLEGESLPMPFFPLPAAQGSSLQVPVYEVEEGRGGEAMHAALAYLQGPAGLYSLLLASPSRLLQHGYLVEMVAYGKGESPTYSLLISEEDPFPAVPSSSVSLRAVPGGLTDGLRVFATPQEVLTHLA